MSRHITTIKRLVEEVTDTENGGKLQPTTVADAARHIKKKTVHLVLQDSDNNGGLAQLLTGDRITIHWYAV